MKNKPTSIFFLLFALTWLLSSSAIAAGAVSEYLVVNNPKVKSFKHSVGNVTVGNPDVVNFKADRRKKRITLFPKQPGSTVLIVFDRKGKQRALLNLTVYQTDPELLVKQIQELLVDVEGISVKRVGGQVVIDGELVLPSDRARVRKIASNSRQVVDLTTVNPDSNQIIARKIGKEIGMDEVSVRSVKGQIILDGEVYSKQARIKAEKIASLYSKNIINVLEVREIPNPPSRNDTIQVTAHFVEVAKNFSRNFNFQWSPIPQVGTSLNYSINPVSGSSNFTGALTGTATDILPKLNYFRALGVARIMENPTVSVKSGDEAIIESGTRLGFPVAQANGAVSLEFQNVGALLKIRPIARGTDVDMTITVKISSLGSPDISGGVAISQNNVETSQLVRSGESVVIGGLVRHSNRKALDRPPDSGGDSSTPTAAGSSFTDPFPLGSLFTLFKSSDLSKQRSQFMVFITPRILKFAKDANRELKEQFNLYEVYPEPGEGDRPAPEKKETQ